MTLGASEPTKSRTFRDTLLRVAPNWLAQGLEDGRESARYMYLIGLLFDLFAERTRQGILARFPATAPESALPLIGKDRRIIRGFEEPADSYRERLRIYLDTWRTAGNGFTLLDQLAAYLTGYEVRMRLVDDRGNWYTREPDGTRVHQFAQHNWNWDGESVDHGGAAWSRGWLIIYPPAELWTAEDVWGSGTWGDGGVWGMTAASEQVRTMRAIVRQFKPLHVKCMWMIFAWDPASFDPASPEPDGTWEHWSTHVGSVHRPARLDTASYADGTKPFRVGGF